MIAVARLRAATRDRAMRAVVVEAEDVRRVVEDLDITLARAAAAEADRDYWRKQATGMAPSVDGMRALCTMLFPGGTGCVVDPERVVAEVERLRERVADAEAEAIRWGDAVVAIGDAIGMQGRSSAEIVEGVRSLRPSIVVLCRSIAAEYDALDDGNAARAVYRAEGARRCADEIEKP